MYISKPKKSSIGRGLTQGQTIGRPVGSNSTRPIIEIDFKQLGKRIKEERIKLNYTQEALAEIVSVSTAFIGHIERAERSLSLDTLVKICVTLGVTIDYLLADTTAPKDEDIIDEFRSLLKDKTIEQKQAVLDIVRTALRHI